MPRQSHSMPEDEKYLRYGIEKRMEEHARQQGWTPELGLLGGTAAVLGAVALLGGPLGPVAAGLLLIPTLAIGDEIKDALEQRRENRFRRDLEVKAGLRPRAPSLRERLRSLLGQLGERIADRAHTDLDTGIWNRGPTAYYELSAAGARPVSPQRAHELRMTSPSLTQVNLRPEGTLMSRYATGRLAGQDGAPAAVRLDMDGKVVGAGWIDGRLVVRPGLTTPSMREFCPGQAAEAIVASYRKPGPPREIERREIAVDTLIWEARQLANSVVDLRLRQREEDDLVQTLRGIETSGLALRRLGIRQVAVDVGSPIDVFDLASKIGAVRERHIEAARAAPVGR